MPYESTNDHPEPKFTDSETALGGADAVEGTTAIVGQGTDPNAPDPAGRPAKVGNRGLAPIICGVIVLVIIVAVVIYAFTAARP